MKIELNPQELEILIAWSEEATKGRFDMGDEPVCFTWEEENLLKKLRDVLQNLAKDKKEKK